MSLLLPALLAVPELQPGGAGTWHHVSAAFGINYGLCALLTLSILLAYSSLGVWLLLLLQWGQELLPGGCRWRCSAAGCSLPGAEFTDTALSSSWPDLAARRPPGQVLGVPRAVMVLSVANSLCSVFSC